MWIYSLNRILFFKVENKFCGITKPYYISGMKIKKPEKQEPRKPRTYRATDTLYSAAEKKAKKDKKPLAVVLEDFLYDYVSR